MTARDTGKVFLEDLFTAVVLPAGVVSRRVIAAEGTGVVANGKERLKLT